VVVAPVPFPISGPDEVVAAVLAGVSPRTRLAMIDHITSPTGLVLPDRRIVAGARASAASTPSSTAPTRPGMLPLDLDALGAAYYTGNFHKWVCAPKGAAMLHVRRDRQQQLHPGVISHGYTSTRARAGPVGGVRLDRHRRPDPWLCVARRSAGSAAAPRRLARAARPQPRPAAARPRPPRRRARRRRRRPPTTCSATSPRCRCPTAMPPSSPLYADPLQHRLFERHRIEVPIPVARPAPPPDPDLGQLYNTDADYEALAVELA
jgi:isopenicillin-N epimerase